MKPLIKYYIALASILLFSLQTVGQNYPVQANLSISSPCPNKLSSLFPLSGSRLNLAILLTDVSQPEIQARISVKIEGAGLTIQSRPDFSMPVFTLQGGIPLALSHQLEPYFRVSSLTATGNGAMQFMQNGILPEGFFTITVTVVEHRRNVPISNNAQAFAWVVVNDPPQLITPTNNQTLEPGGVQNVFISWIPRHVVTPMAGSQIYYNLSLWEVPQGFDPQMVVSSLQPLETVSTLSTNVIWGPDKSALTPGKRYVVAVKAVDSNNEVIFKNNGLSVAHSFVYGQPCLTPINLDHSNVFIQTADVAWYALGAAQNFRVEFKPSSEADDAWRNLDVSESKITISNLAPNTKYAYRVSAVCGSFVSNPTANRTFTTQAMQPLDNTCTPEVIVPQPDQSPLLSNLTPGLVFMAAGFMVEAVTFKEIAPYTFDGTGIITLPLYKFALRANLKGVQINHSLHLVGGTVEAQYGDELTFLGEQGDEDQGPGSVDFSNPNDTIVLNSPIDSVYMNHDGTWTVVETDGDTTVITPGEGGTMVVDEDGNGVVIVGEEIYPVSDVFNDDPNGNGSGGGTGGGTGPNISPTSICNQRVNFAPGGSMHKYGFDTYKENLPSGTYSTIRVGEETLHLPWKSVATGGSDRLLVTPTADSTLSFSYQGGMPLTGSSTADGYHLWSGSPPAGEDNLLALCSADSAGNASVAGGVRVKAYDLKRHKLAVVPVGSSQPSFTKAELQTALNSIYAQAVTEWEVTFEEPLDADGLTETPEVNETDYSNDMRAIWRAYVGQRTPVPGTTYLFIIPSFANNTSMVGYMPLRSGYGFLTPTATTRDAAHELGHGVFNLRHTFSDNNVVNLPQGSTKNLMDYSTGTELFKYQWDYIHNPEGGWFVFEDSEEGASIRRITWLGNYFWGLAPDPLERKVEDNLNLFKYVFNNNDEYYSKSQKENINLSATSYSSWSARMAAHENGVCQTIFRRMREEATPTFNLWENGIFFEDYTMEETNYRLAVYSMRKSVPLSDAVRIQNFSSLRNNTSLKAGYTSDYGLIVFYEGEEVSMVIQVFGGTPKAATEQWLNYLGLVLPSEQQADADRSILNRLSSVLHTIQKLREIWGVKKEYDGTDAPSFDINSMNAIRTITVSKIDSVFGIQAACNVGVREAVYQIANDPLLFPTTGLQCYATGESLVKGDVTHPGRASNIVNDLENEELTKFKLLPSVKNPYNDSQDIPDFNRIQELANAGHIVIGVRINDGGIGHIVLAVPGELYTYYSGTLNQSHDVPMVLDCGQGEKFSEVPASAKWYQYVINTKWYIYKPLNN